MLDWTVKHEEASIVNLQYNNQYYHILAGFTSIMILPLLFTVERLIIPQGGDKEWLQFLSRC